jgi:hypothetical protein
MPKIAVLSSTAFKDSNRDGWFKSKLNLGTTTLEYFNGAGDYKKDSSAGKLKDEAEKIPREGPFDLIVTVGGIVAAEAAAKLKKNDFGGTPPKGFVSIFGGLPSKTSKLLEKDADHITFLGGVSLDTPNSNPERVKSLMNNFEVTNVTKIWLYYNKNSQLHEVEKEDWDFYVRGGTLESSVNQTAYDPNDFNLDFANKIPPDAQAVVISADAFFGSRAAHLLAAAKMRGLPVCYPTELYDPQNPAKAVVYGPDFEQAFKALGTKAAVCIAAANPSFMGVEKMPSKQRKLTGVSFWRRLISGKRWT